MDTYTRKVTHSTPLDVLINLDTQSYCYPDNPEFPWMFQLNMKLLIYKRDLTSNLKFQESFKHIQQQRTTIPISVDIISVLTTKFFQFSFPRILLLQNNPQMS